MKAMIFSAGLGTRFKPWTDSHPKALAMVNGKSLLQRNIEYLQKAGIYDVIVNVHHFAEQIEEAIEINNGWGSRVQISDERNLLLETGGGLLHAEKLFTPGEKFITCNVDILTDLDIAGLTDFHEKQNAFISFGVTDRKSSRNFLFDQSGHLCGWRNNNTGEEKISVEKTPLTPKAYSCVVVFEYNIFEAMKKSGFDGKFSLVDLYLALASRYSIMGFDHSGDKLVDVGRTESIAIASSVFL
jgi:MurNAc alpha-1-phosphate uridylyltransferase